MAITVTAGSRLTSAVYNTNVPASYVQASDQTATTTTLANHNTFSSLALAASGLYEVRVYLDVDGPQASDVKTLWVVSGGATIGRRWGLGMGTDAATTPNIAATASVQVRANSGSVSYGTGADTTLRTMVQESFLATTTTAGTLTLQWAQATAGGTTTVYAGSWLVIHRLS